MYGCEGYVEAMTAPGVPGEPTVISRGSCNSLLNVDMIMYQRIWIYGLPVLLILGLAACQPEAPPVEEPPTVTLTEQWTLTDSLRRPESVVYDPIADMLYVSNIEGSPSEKDGNGFIAKVTTDGQLDDPAWVTGLHAPKGLALSEGLLYVADIDALIAVDPVTGELIARYPAEGAQFLNDVTADADGNVYVSDSRTGTIYRLAGATLEVWVEGPQVQAPNGVYAMPDHLVVAAGDTAAENPGQARSLKTVGYEDQAISPLGSGEPLGGIDAVEPDTRGGFFLSDWGAGTVMHFTPGAGATTLLELTQGTADLTYVAAQERIYLPIMMSDQLVAYQVEWAP